MANGLIGIKEFDSKNGFYVVSKDFYDFREGEREG